VIFFKEILNLWKSENLLSQAWDETSEMMELSHQMFEEAIYNMREGDPRQKLIKLKNEIRRLIITKKKLEKK